jgi:hypothetical protein
MAIPQAPVEKAGDLTFKISAQFFELGVEHFGYNKRKRRRFAEG